MQDPAEHQGSTWTLLQGCHAATEVSHGHSHGAGTQQTQHLYSARWCCTCEDASHGGALTWGGSRIAGASTKVSASAWTAALCASWARSSACTLPSWPGSVLGAPQQGLSATAVGDAATSAMLQESMRSMRGGERLLHGAPGFSVYTWTLGIHGGATGSTSALHAWNKPC